MPMSEAALAGIETNGRGWKHRIGGLRPLTQRIGQFNDRGGPQDMGEAAELDGILKTIARKVTTFRENNPEFAEDWRLDDVVEWLEDNDTVQELDDSQDPEAWMGEVNYQLNELCDWSDYNRVLID